MTSAQSPLMLGSPEMKTGLPIFLSPLLTHEGGLDILDEQGPESHLVPLFLRAVLAQENILSGTYGGDKPIKLPHG